MAYEISGYVLEPVRVGQSNGTFTQTPDVYVANEVAFNAAYPSSETAPRVDYCVLVTSEGVGRPGLLEFARFGYTKNEVIDRFFYDAQAGAFRTLRGSAPIEVGVLSEESNTARLKVRSPAQLASLPAAPIRLAVGSVGSGFAWSVTVVPDDGSFGTPALGAAELSLETGNLHWNESDLIIQAGQRVRFQQQQFFQPKESNGRLGLAPTSTFDPPLVLNPLPATGQHPRLRFGYRRYLTAVEVPNEASLGSPATGVVHWARDTGALKFNDQDAAANVGIPVYYDGVLLAAAMQLPSQALGAIGSPAILASLPPAGGDLIFTLNGVSPYYRFPTITYRAAASFNAGKQGEVQVDLTTGLVRFSAADQTAHAGRTITVTHGDLSVERGITLRLFRNPVNLDGARDLKDVTEIYSVEGAAWADPIIESSQVVIPSLPINDPAYPMAVKILQGQGNYVSDQFQDMDGLLPSAGLGYYIDYDQGIFFFAQRKEALLVPGPVAGSDVLLPDQLLRESNLSLELAPPGGGFTPLTVGDDVLVDTLSGMVSFTATDTRVTTGTISSLPSLMGLQDLQQQFLTVGVQPGHLVVLSGQAVYTVVSLTQTELQLDVALPAEVVNVPYAIYESREVLADRFFDEVVLLDPSTKVQRIRALGSAANGALSIPLAYLEGSGFRFGEQSGGTFATLSLVDTDGDFSGSTAGVVELSRETGNLNFADEDLGTPVYWARTLTPKVDYQLQPELGLVQLSERLLSLEEVLITYSVSDESVTEYARFLVRKEVTADHPNPTSSLFFNPDGLTVAANPSPAVFRGGRPQKLGIQCTVSAEQSTITFLADNQLTDALPHGAIVAPEERVYIDYYVMQAVGGEKTFTVLQPPMVTFKVSIAETDDNGDPVNSFVVRGDQTQQFPAGHLMRIESDYIHLIGSSSYNASDDATTVVLYDTELGDEPSQVFQETLSDPKIYVSSGPTPIVAAPMVPSYFAAELAQYEPIARGSNTFLIPGDVTVRYRPGTVVLFADGVAVTDFYQVLGAQYEAAVDRSTVMLAVNVRRQYEHGQVQLSRSVRPVFEPPLTEVQTSRLPKLAQPVLVYRRVSGEPGEALTPAQYTIDDAGKLVFAEPLQPYEEFGICYTGADLAVPGSTLRASYTSQVTPSALNGILGQKLFVDYFIGSPDTFYFRVEPMQNFRGEFAAEIEAAASSGSSGPLTSNAAQMKLWDQGRKSLFFDERHLANQDIIARGALVFYNDFVNSIESYRRTVDGTVVGNNDGLLLFDGVVGRVAPPAAVGNQIDDAIKVSNAPYAVTIPPSGIPALASIGTFQKYYLPGALSRFYPTAKNYFGFTISININAINPGAEILDTRATNVTQIVNLHRRQAWGVVTESTAYTGNTILKVDFASGNEPGFEEQAQKYARIRFWPGMKCAVMDRNGALLDISVTVTDPITDHQVTVTGLTTTAIPVGATIYQTLEEHTGFMQAHYVGRDFGFNGETGQITYFPTVNGVSTALSSLTAYAGRLMHANTLTEPARFPALFGGVEDDDGGLSFPVQGPDPNCESGSHVDVEHGLIDTSVGVLRAITTAPRISTGSVLSPNFFTIVDSTISTMSPAPQPGGLVRILTGDNSATGFRRVVTVGATFLIVDNTAAGFVASSNFTYELAVSANVASGTATGGSIVQLNHTGATFLSSVRVGYTVVITQSGVHYRRQIHTITSNTSLSFWPALSTAVGAGTVYRVENSLATYGNRTGTGMLDYLQKWDAALAGQQTVYPSQQAFLQTIIDQATEGVLLYGIQQETVNRLVALRDAIAALVAPIAALRAKLAPATVIGFDAANIFAVSVLKSDMDARETQVEARLSVLSGTVIPTILDLLTSSEALYDKRYVWIDARINLEKGLLVRQELATKERIKAQAEALKQLTKLLAVEVS